jgi:hypothetical protein
MSLYTLIEATGLSDPQEIADAIKAKGLTHQPINRAELIHLLNMRGMLRKIVSNNTSEKWEGTVLNMQDAILAAGTDAQKNGIRLWFSHVTNVSNNVWDTTQESFARPFREMVQAFANVPTMPTQADFDAVLALGGGWRYESLTAEQVTAAIAAEQERIAQDAIAVRNQDWRTRFDAILNQIGTVEQADGAAALRAMADEMEAV